MSGLPENTPAHGRDNSTPFAGMTRIRFEGLRLPALSAPFGAPLSLM